MTMFTRDLIHRIVGCVLLLLFVFQRLPRVTCQQDSKSADRDRETNFSVGTTIGIILLGLFVSTLIFCCSFYALFSFYYRRLLAAEGHEVLHRGETSGVEKEIIESFPVFLYSEVKRLKLGEGGVECAICLKEFEDQETLRWMPPCSHTFHANCIDMWLSSQSTCPVCRANLSLKLGDCFPYPSMDLETGNARRDVVKLPDEISLTDSSNVTWNNNANYRTTRSRSTGSLPSWRRAEIFYPRSYSTGHSLVQLGKNLDRFKLQLPEEMQRQLVGLKSHVALPRARSSRQGYRSGFSQG
ncbi:unnamed protein product [Arabidopsis arenosa]|uniref:RING-type E3 ubiquitin transferase n=1 Tax=Arabidopsis arenosa TaxID=38785 RepID=A0A8S2APC6_ARAAE|nr:unnamed protein product [Arabidopsis arenosa]